MIHAARFFALIGFWSPVRGFDFPCLLMSGCSGSFSFSDPVPSCDSGVSPSVLYRFCLLLFTCDSSIFVLLLWPCRPGCADCASLLPGCLYFRHCCRFLSDSVLSACLWGFPPVFCRDVGLSVWGPCDSFSAVGWCFTSLSVGVLVFWFLFLAFRRGCFSLRLLLLLCDGLLLQCCCLSVGALA